LCCQRILIALASTMVLYQVDSPFYAIKFPTS